MTKTQPINGNATMKKITSKRELAIALSNGPVEIASIGKRLMRTVVMWAGRNEVAIEGNQVTLVTK